MTDNTTAASRSDVLLHWTLFPETGVMKVSSRNVLEGTIKSIHHGMVNTEVTLVLHGGQEVVSVITKASAERLELAVGKPVYALIKASDVVLGVA
jgi:molybdopterin-binding protein